MPNWCNNTLELCDGKVKMKDVLKDYLTTMIVKDYNGNDEEVTILDFRKIIPFPKCIADTVHLWDHTAVKKQDWDKHLELIKEAEENNFKECGYKSWYDWSVQHWGTKWNSDQLFMSDTGASFVTAWSPPCEVIAELAKITNQNLRMTYIEEGEAFCGELLAGADGSVVDNCYNIDDAPKSLLDEVGCEKWEG